MDQADILVLGATGFTGKLITKYLSNHRERASFTLAIAGRSKSKLSSLVSELGLDSQVEIRQVDVTRPEEVDRAVKGVKVVINTVGPYCRWGTPVVKACVRYGVHYVDLTGETAWIYEIISECDFAATRTHSIIIPSCGYDSIPSDATVHLSSKTLKAHLGSQATIGESTSAFELKGGVSGGTLGTAIAILEDFSHHKLRVAAADWALSPVKGLRGPRLKLLRTLPILRPPVFGGIFVMARSNQAIVQRTWGLQQLSLHRSSVPAVKAEAQQRNYGTEFRYSEFHATNSAWKGILLSLGVITVSVCLALSSSARWLLKRFVISTVDGPSPDVQKNGFFITTNVSTSSKTSGPTTHVKSVMRGHGDPGYSLTAIMISESALSILLESSALPAITHEGGILTPMSALGDVLIRRLEASGSFEFESAVIKEGEEETKKRR